MHYSIEEVYNYKNDNCINLDELKIYLKDIFDSIGEEITKITKKKNQYVENNWRHKANPCLMQTLSKIDKGDLLINYELNKITAANYKNVLATIKNGIDINSTKYVSTLVKKIFSKILTNELFLESHMKFLTCLTAESTSNFANEISEYYVDFINIESVISPKTDDPKDIEPITISKTNDTSSTSLEVSSNITKKTKRIKHNNEYYIFGLITSHLIASDIIDINTAEKDINIMINNINNLFEWKPINMQPIECYIYMLLGVHRGNKHVGLVTKIGKQLTSIIKNQKISMKLKFHILNILENRDGNTKTEVSPKAKPTSYINNDIDTTNDSSVKNVAQQNNNNNNMTNKNSKSTNGLNENVISKWNVINTNIIADTNNKQIEKSDDNTQCDQNPWKIKTDKNQIKHDKKQFNPKSSRQEYTENVGNYSHGHNKSIEKKHSNNGGNHNYGSAYGKRYPKMDKAYKKYQCKFVNNDKEKAKIRDIPKDKNKILQHIDDKKEHKVKNETVTSNDKDYNDTISFNKTNYYNNFEFNRK
jgi:hypothetical protein